MLTPGSIIHVYSRFDPTVPTVGLVLQVDQHNAIVRLMSPHTVDRDLPLAVSPGHDHQSGIYWWEWPRHV